MGLIYVLIFFLVDFHVRNWCIPGFYENKTQHCALFSTKTNQGRFYFHWVKLLQSCRKSFSCQSRDTSCRQSWVLKSGLRYYGSSRNFHIAGSGLFVSLNLLFGFFFINGQSLCLFFTCQKS